jgi:hypothetical protein
MALGFGEERLQELRKTGGILKRGYIAAGVLELIEDDSRAGSGTRITVRGGREYAMP